MTSKFLPHPALAWWIGYCSYATVSTSSSAAGRKRRGINDKGDLSDEGASPKQQKLKQRENQLYSNVYIMEKCML